MLILKDACGRLFWCVDYTQYLKGGVSMNWITLILGIWVFISPWLLGFSDNAAGLWSNILSGLILVIVAIYGLSNSEA